MNLLPKSVPMTRAMCASTSGAVRLPFRTSVINRSSLHRKSSFSTPVSRYSSSAYRGSLVAGADKLRIGTTPSHLGAPLSVPSWQQVRTMASGYQKIKVKNPVVELDGDEVSFKNPLRQNIGFGKSPVLHRIVLPAIHRRVSFALELAGGIVYVMPRATPLQIALTLNILTHP